MCEHAWKCSLEHVLCLDRDMNDNVRICISTCDECALNRVNGNEFSNGDIV